MGVSTDAALIPLAKNFSELLTVDRVNRSVSSLAGASYASPELKSLAGSLKTTTGKYAGELTAGGKVVKYGGIGLSFVGGAIGAYGEYNQTNGNVAKTVTVGIGDTAIGVGAGVVGTYAGAAIGGLVGSVIPVGGTIIGAAAGAAIGGFVGLAASNAFNDAVNSRVWNDVTSLF
jgi:hypothetical protein